MSLLGPDGLAQVASASLANTRALRDSLASLAGVEAVFSAAHFHETVIRLPQPVASVLERLAAVGIFGRSEEHTSELQSLMRISYAVFCLKKKRTRHTIIMIYQDTKIRQREKY